MYSLYSTILYSLYSTVLQSKISLSNVHRELNKLLQRLLQREGRKDFRTLYGSGCSASRAEGALLHFILILLGVFK